MGDRDGTLRLVLNDLAVRDGDLSHNLIRFAALLKAGEIEATTGQLIGAARSLSVIDVSRREDFRQALVANLLTSRDDRQVFDLLFDRFWRLPGEEPAADLPSPDTLSGGDVRLGAADEVDVAYTRGQHAAARPAETEPRSYSAEDAFLRKDFATFRDEEVREARRYIRRLAPKLSTALSRRRRAARSGSDLDLRRSLKAAARQGGEVSHLLYRRPKIRRRDIVLLCDVSGSMDVYSRFLTQFLYAMQHELRGVSTFVFSTRLFDVTPTLRARSFDEAVAQLASSVDGWSGGTRIGACLGEFNQRYGKLRLGRRTVLVVISDGWDRGDIAQLEREMRLLKRRAYRVVWLNPLLGADGYRPHAQGMAAALPSVDEFLPVHNLASLGRVGRTLVRLSRR
jgi:uncharacterized protein with von Willebrand factor type A (vWA) domain